MSNFFQTLKKFDLLGVEPLFFVNKNVRYKSFSGSIQVLILLIIFLKSINIYTQLVLKI